MSCGKASEYLREVPSGDPTLWTTTEQAAAIARSELGSEELLGLFLARIESLNGDGVTPLRPELAGA